MFRSVIYNCSQQQQPYSGHVYLDRSCSCHLWDDCRVQTYHSVTVLLFRSLKTTATLVNYTAQSGIKLAPEFTFDNIVCICMCFITISLKWSMSFLSQGPFDSYRHTHSCWFSEDQKWKWHGQCVIVREKNTIT